MSSIGSRIRQADSTPGEQNDEVMQTPHGGGWPEEFPEGLQTGRIWGIWNEELLPVRWETAEVNLRDAFKIRRIYRKLAKRRGSGSLRRITVFVRHENVVRLLALLGYCLE
jgi:hypothetical protein